MKTLSLISSIALVLLSGCVSVPVTPARLATVTDRTQDRDASLKHWREAVVLGNAFLSSDFRKTLPPGQLRLTDDGMEFVTGNTVLPVRVRCTWWGDFLIPAGMAAQERSDGFVVGSVTPNRSRLLDNSFFKDSHGHPLPGFAMAELTLHELTHSYYRCGTVSFTKGVRYYAEAIFLFRYRNHSMERLPFQTTTEFMTFILSTRNEHSAPANPVK